MKKTAIILGTARSNGNTATVTEEIANELSAKVFDINKYNILPFDYEYKNQDDDFLSLIKEILTYENIVFSTPVYWFSPSMQMKLFLDRMTDLITIKKELGRKLKGKNAALISTGETEKPENCFEEIFKHTFDYLGMTFKGKIHCACPFDDTGKIETPSFDYSKYKDSIQIFCSQLK